MTLVSIFNINYSSYIFLIYTYTLPLLFEILSNIGLSTNLDMSLDYLDSYNLLLNNSINKLHPALIYISLIFLVTVLFLYNNKLCYRLLNSTQLNLSIITTSLALGG
jgi:hypothetical protein